MQAKALIIVPHTHWDREWYMSFSKHRYKLVKFMDTLVETLETRPDFASFHLDGQTIILDDYLEVRPKMRARIERLVKDGRICTGPFYILQDEYLTNGESNVRNALLGLREAKKYGATSMAGYFPDAFGNVSQMPQILQGFGIESAFFGRGIIPVGYANEVLGKTELGFSELVWEAPDGSRVIGVQFINWYHNAYQLPADPDKAAERLQWVIDSGSFVARTPYPLGMNGCDHQPVQTDLPDILESVKDKLSVPARIDTLDGYTKAIKPFRDSFYIYRGEINGQNGNGRMTLIETASARIPLKILNNKAEHLIQHAAEPLAVFAETMTGKKYDRDILTHAWKKLMQNHPHDSICGCHCDEVGREMVVRYGDCIDTLEFFISDTKGTLAQTIRTDGGGDKNIVVFNTGITPAACAVEATVDYREGESVPSSVQLLDIAAGAAVDAVWQQPVKQKRFTLPDDRFREIFDVTALPVRFFAQIPPLSYRVFAVKEGAEICKQRVTADAKRHTAENTYFKIQFRADGTFDFYDKTSGKTAEGLHYFQDVGDIGDEYIYRPTAGGDILSIDGDAEIALIVDTPLKAVYRVCVTMQIPDSAVKSEKRRSKTFSELKLVSLVSVEAEARLVKIRTTVSNHSKNHRIRAMFEPNICTDVSIADGQFDLVERKINPGEQWTNPANSQRMTAYVTLQDSEKNGFVVAGRGLNEYEVERSGKNTIGLTLLRSVGEIGDWFYFPTPDAQMQGEHTVEYAIGAFLGNAAAQAQTEAYDFCYPTVQTTVTDAHAGKLPPAASLIGLEAAGCVRFSALKKCEERESYILRVFNPSIDSAQITLTDGIARAYSVNLNEDRLKEIKRKDGRFTVSVPAKKIVSIEIEG